MTVAKSIINRVLDEMELFDGEHLQPTSVYLGRKECAELKGVRNYWHEVIHDHTVPRRMIRTRVDLNLLKMAGLEIVTVERDSYFRIA